MDCNGAVFSDSGATYETANGGVNSDFVSEAAMNGVSFLDLNNEPSRKEEASCADSKLETQPEKLLTVTEDDTVQSINGRTLPDLLPSTDAVQVSEASSDHVCMCRESRSADTFMESLLASAHSECHSAHLGSPLFHEDKHMLLDPNAQEFTPAPLPSHNFPLNDLMPLSLPFPILNGNPVVYGNGVDIGTVFYNHDFNNRCQGLPIFGSNSPLGYAPVSDAHAAWNGHPVRYVVQSDLSQQCPPVPVLPPTICEQEPRASFQLQRAARQNNTSMAISRRHSWGMAVLPTIMGREHVSRALLLSGVPATINDGELRCELEQWGPVRAMGLEKRQEGSVTVCYFDLRNAKDALKDIQQQHLLQQQRIQQQFQLFQQKHCKNDNDPLTQRDVTKVEPAKLKTFTEGRSANDTDSSRGLIGGKAVWAQYVVPFGPEAGPDSMNQGTLVVFNLDADVSLDALRVAFEVHGTVKELRETPARRQHKFVEFFDVRDAAGALTALDGKEVCGRRVKIEFSRPGGQARRARAHEQFQGQCQLQQGCSPCSGSVAGLSTVVSHVQGRQFMWEWNGDPSLCHGHTFPCPPQAYVMSNYGQVPSAAPFNSVNCVVPHWNGPEVHPQSLGYAQHSKASASTSPSLSVSEVLPFGAAIERDFGNGSYGGSNKGSMTAADTLGRRGRSGSVPGCYPHSNFQNVDGFKPLFFCETRCGQHIGKQAMSSKNARDIVQTRYVFDEFEAESSSSSNRRTTLMIRNIPNKYSQQMILELLDQHCLRNNKQIVDRKEPLSAYDFVYLPIDFKNKCNLGYAFVNFTTIQATVRLYKAFHEQQWEAFNSRKICQVTYARVQGKAALEEHFRNSRFNCEINEYLPLVFSPPRTGIECPPPTVAVCSSGNSLQEDNGSAKTAEHRDSDGDQQSAPDYKWS